MADIVIAGAGIGGLCTAMLLAKDGHQVTVLERDPAPPPESPVEAWASWERRGVNQFRLGHLILPRFRLVLEAELPSLVTALDAAGALRFNPMASAPEFITGGRRDGDDAFEIMTARRPVYEAAIARETEETPGVTIRRGTAVAGLAAAGEATSGVPHVNGVVTESGEAVPADLVIDACGRRSPLPRWLEAIGAGPLYEELEDCGFQYYGRTYRSADGALPMMLGGVGQSFDSINILTLPADHGSWAAVIATSAKDAELRKLRDTATWERAFRLYPTVAHWIDAEPFEEDVTTMAKIEDRIRRLVVDGRPVVAGVAMVADAYSCTNPSVGRGISLGLIHAVELRDLIRVHPLDDPAGFTVAWDDVTEATLTPWYRDTLWGDRHRLAEIDTQARGERYEPEDPKWHRTRALGHAGGSDPDLFRPMLSNAMLQATLDQIFADRAFTEKILEKGAGWRDAPSFGPTRADLLATVNG